MLEMQNRFDLREHRLERVAELADRGVERDHEHRLDDLRLGEMRQRRSKSRPSGGAFKQYRSCVDILRGELNAAPEAATTRLYLDIRRRRDEADASPEQTVPQPPDEPPGMLPAAVRRRNLTLVAGLGSSPNARGNHFWLSLSDPEPPPRAGSGQPGIIPTLT